ncbi:Peptidase S24-like [Xylanibacter ruminicola]|uniref:Peptidase S24-like n=1 Tax=Xylanibacter ruminicola TaxID=839 RepID=A0A1H5WE95_XYLRU|nr:restriction endonuclease subunit S [Xylanibacter ruminicola]SEF97501.1 Peptidase S24-like [Xylanibacter ruminicola]
MERKFIKNGGEYRKCLASSLFEIKGNPQLDKDSFTFGEDSKYPYFTRTVFNNGILGYVDYLDDEHLINGNSLAVGMMGMRFFYMKHDFYAGQFTKTAFPLFEGFNELVALWFISWFNKSSQKYLGLLVRDFENAFNNTELTVPYNKNGKVAVDYIESRIRELEESCIRELEESRIHELKSYLKVAGVEDIVLTQAEITCLQRLNSHGIDLKSFKIGDIFNDYTGRDIIIRETEDGDIPLISHQHNNNGISKYVAPIEGRKVFNHKDTIPLADRGVFLATTQDVDFHIGTRVKALSFKDGEKSEAVRLFFVTAINKLQVWFSEYLTNATNSLPGLSIYLPVTTDGIIDFEFMDTYINAIKKLCIASLKEEISREHKAYEKAVGVNSNEVETDKEENKVVVLSEYREGCIPLYTLRAACGAFEDGEVPEAEGWIDASNNGFTPDPKRYFVIHAKGNSMLPKIKDGDLCVFEWYRAGSRNGEIVLTQSSEFDSEYGGKYTIKKYHSEKVVTEEGWQHNKVELIPLNNDFGVIELNEEDKYRTIGILKYIL